MAQQYLRKLREVNDYHKPVTVAIETVAAQEYLAKDAEKHMPVDRSNRATVKKPHLSAGATAMRTNKVLGAELTFPALACVCPGMRRRIRKQEVHKI